MGGGTHVPSDATRHAFSVGYLCSDFSMGHTCDFLALKRESTISDYFPRL